MNSLLLLVVVFCFQSSFAVLFRTVFDANSMSDCKQFLVREEGHKPAWYAGCPNSVAILRKDKRLTIHIGVSGNVVAKEFTLNVLCSKGAMKRGPFALDTNTKMLTISCNDDMTFTLKPVETISTRDTYMEFYLTLTDSSIPIDKVFETNYQMYVEAKVINKNNVKTDLKSHYLTIFSFDSLFYLEEFGKFGYLAKSGLDLFTRTPYTKSYDSFPSVKFLASSFFYQFNSASLFFQNLVEVGAFIDLGSQSCENTDIKAWRLSSKIANVNYNGEAQIFYYLNMQNGDITFSRLGLAQFAKQLADTVSDKKYSICLSIGVGSAISFKRKLFNKVGYYDSDTYQTDSTGANECKKLSNIGDNTKYRMYNGVSRYSVKCPIICNFAAKIEFKRGDKIIMRTGTGSRNDAVVSQNTLILPDENKDATLSGPYTCSYQQNKFLFEIEIVQLPVFHFQQSSWGLLPTIIYAMEGQFVQWNCSIFYISEFKPKLKSNIYRYSSSSITAENYYSLFDAPTNGILYKETIEEIDHTAFKEIRLSHKVLKVPSTNKLSDVNFTHYFECSADAAVQEVQHLPIPEYKVTNGAHIVYVPIPNQDKIVADSKNKCSVQGCSSDKESSFKFSVKPDFMNYLKDIGVTIQGYFLLGNMNIQSMEPLKSVISMKFKDNKLQLTISALKNNQELLKILEDHKILTAVFNFLYNDSLRYDNIHLNKSVYGTPRTGDSNDCRNIVNCFYSTSFTLHNSANKRLDHLSVELQFDKETSSANLGVWVAIAVAIILILIIIAVVIYLCTTDHGKTYLLGKKERQQGLHPEEEVKAEVFSEYQRPEKEQLMTTTRHNEVRSMNDCKLSDMETSSIESLNEYNNSE